MNLLREELKTLRGAAATDRQQAVQEAAALRHELDEVRAAAASASADAEEQCAEELRTLRQEAENGKALAAKADQERVQKLRAEQEARDQSKAAVDAAARGPRAAEAERDAVSAQDNAASKMARTESVHGNTTMESLGIQIQDKIQEQIETILVEIETILDRSRQCSTDRDNTREVVGSTGKVQPALDEIRQEVHSAKMAAENASLSARQAAQELSLARSGHALAVGALIGCPSNAGDPHRGVGVGAGGAQTRTSGPQDVGLKGTPGSPKPRSDSCRARGGRAARRPPAIPPNSSDGASIGAGSGTTRGCALGESISGGRYGPRAPVDIPSEPALYG